MKSNLIGKDIGVECTGLFSVLCYRHTIQQRAHVFPSIPFAPDTPVQVPTVQLFRSSLFYRLYQWTGPLGKFPEREDAAVPFLAKTWAVWIPLLWETQM